MIASLPLLISKVESADNPSALRFEPAVFDRIRNSEWTIVLESIVRFNRCTRDTARVVYSCSWGRYQIMGLNVYGACEVQSPIAEFLANGDLQDAALHNFLARIECDQITPADLLQDEAKRTKFITRYNGPGNVEAYWARLLPYLS
jgi:hypothetical protein